MFAMAIKQAYCNVGFSIPTSKSAKALICSVFFTPEVYDRLCSGSFERRSLAGNANSTQSVTLLISINGASPFNLQEADIMDDDARIREAVRLFSQLSPEKQQFFLIFLRTWIAYREACYV